jgi:gliding motility-associated-like protein
MRYRFLLFFWIFVVNYAVSQNEANVWYFQSKCGLDFKTGIPMILNDGHVNVGIANATISDSLGNYLFSCDWQYYYTKNGSIMQNGEVLLCPGHSGLTIVKWPGTDKIYYVFTSGNVDINPGFYYSLVDMKLFNGQGAVIEKNIPVGSGWDVSGNVAIVKREGTENIWVITRKFYEDALAAYLVDENGLNPNPVLSMRPDREDEATTNWGFIKISPDKKFLISTYQNFGHMEISRFDAFSGKSDYMYTITQPVEWPYIGLIGIEFSPDSKYLYTNYGLNSIDTTVLYQYDMKLILDSTEFTNTAICIGRGSTTGLQLARDGKIYCTSGVYEDIRYWSDVIHNPWVRGVGCNYEENVVNNYPNTVHFSFPNILVDYLLRFEWTGEQCQGYPIQFKPNFIPTPQTIQWDFDDGPGSNSWQLSPTYTFKNPGVHEVKVDVWYPSGRYEHTSREIEISPSPLPLLGNDTLICEDATITLNANCDADFFSWSTGQFGVSSITVSDSGTYWVRGRFNDSGCMGYDTIHVGLHPPTIIDETNLVLMPTTCNGTSGSITGLAAVGMPPFGYRWVDLSEVEYGTDIDVSGLPAGQYYLTITDANGCETVSEVYTIEDAGDLQLTQVQTTRPHCFKDDGQIVVHAFSPSGSILEYSIDAGVNYQSDSIFSNLFASSYAVQVRDENGCSGFYLDNPVLLEDIPGPQVTEVNVTDETDFLGNGVIEIVANGSTPVIYYSIDGGVTWQENDGGFYNLQSRIYNLQVWDENGCDTNFTVEIQNVILTYLHAVTEEGGHCLGNTAMVPVYVDNFNSVADFHLKLGYNSDNLACEGFINVNVQLLDSLTGWVDQAAGKIHLAWNNELPLTFSQQAKVADLVFTTKNPGQGEIAWYTGETESYFTNSSGNPIPAEFSTGQVTVYEPPEIILNQSKTVCTGQFANLMSIAVGNQPPLTFRWIYPAGDTTDNDPFFFSVTQANAGLYTLKATDRVGCTDQKSIELIVSDNPVATFHGTDTLEMQAGDVLDAGSGLASYLWNTGDTTESIVILSAGMYWVGMESLIGCVGTDSVYVKLIEDEIPPEPNNRIFIPNAFSPDGDGINDNFNISYNNNPFPISHFVLHIFNRWGEEIFQSTDITYGWDGKKNGKDCPGGVYVYKIVFSVDGIPGNQERVGTVMLVR